MRQQISSYDLRKYTKTLLQQRTFYSVLERAALIVKLRRVLRRLHKIEHNLAPLCVAEPTARVATDTSPDDIQSLIRQVQNRLAVLPMEPINSEVKAVKLVCSKEPIVKVLETVAS